MLLRPKNTKNFNIATRVRMLHFGKILDLVCRKLLAGESMFFKNRNVFEFTDIAAFALKRQYKIKIFISWPFPDWKMLNLWMIEYNHSALMGCPRTATGGQICGPSTTVPTTRHQQGCHSRWCPTPNTQYTIFKKRIRLSLIFRYISQFVPLLRLNVFLYKISWSQSDCWNKIFSNPSCHILKYERRFVQNLAI